MRYFGFINALCIVAAIFYFGCKTQLPPVNPVPCKADTVYVEKPVIVQVPVRGSVHDTVVIYREDRHTIDSLKSKLFVASYKIERVRYYSRIVQRNPKQGKFLLGWVIRAIN